MDHSDLQDLVLSKKHAWTVTAKQAHQCCNVTSLCIANKVFIRFQSHRDPRAR